MKHLLLSAATIVAMGLGGVAHAETNLTLQRFFGACDADFGTSTDVAGAVTECGIITTLINKFQQDNPDIKVNVNVVKWPGYDQLTAQLASNSAPDLVSMHYTAIPDFSSRGLLVPAEELLAKQGITPDLFTDAARNGATNDGKLYALPFDNWMMLFHVNVNLMKAAGLVNADGTPKIPTSVDEMIQQGKQLQEKTGKTYMLNTEANAKVYHARTFYMLLFQQNADIFKDPTKVDLSIPEAKIALEAMKRIMDDGIQSKGLDVTAITNMFLAGDGAAVVQGTWRIGNFTTESHKAESPFYNGYAVYPFPQLFPGSEANYVDGHGWVMPRKDRTDAEVEATGKLYKFLFDNDMHWARTGHLPSVKAVCEMPEFTALENRSDISKLATIGKSLPAQVQSQFAINDIIGEEVGSAVHGQKSVDEALATAQSRINDLLDNL